MSSTTVDNKMSINSITHPETQEERPAWTTAFWPRLRDSLIEDPELFNHLHLECGICLTDMSIFPHEHTFSHDPNRSFRERTMSHRAQILPCGHMFGYKCLQVMIAEANIPLDEEDEEDDGEEEEEEIPQLSCPSCRVVFSAHIDCPHPHSGMPMPTTMEGVYAMPPTFSEGGVLSHSCAGCVATEMISVIDVLSDVFLPPQHLTDEEILIVSGTAPDHRSWDVSLGDFKLRDFNHFVRDIPLGDALQRICDEINGRLEQNTKRRWCSDGFSTLKFGLKIHRYNPPQAD
ncbi:hypothetical protein FACUT_8193 [Fusarium acutatum]|uniref:RING-type domain-containing protein n=1 Tax=Fusarium acutatum TaxID=78861 RepID=A0A8H4JNE0_9HYPO|nr:hypothetical protein FACUT_8193 [Fusarium acutatum]